MFRQGAWDPINKRRHDIVKVYTSDVDENDVVVLGKVFFGHKNGQSISEDFAGNFQFSAQEKGLIQAYQAWVVS